MPEVHAISSSDESDEEAWEHPAPPGMMPPHGMMQHGMPPGMMLPPGAYFNPQGYHYYPVPQGLPPTHYYPDGPVASLGEQSTGMDPGQGSSRDESQEEQEPEAEIQLDPLAQALLASSEVSQTILRNSRIELFPSWDSFPGQVVNKMLSSFQEVTGSPVGEEVARTTSQIWLKGRTAKVSKQLAEDNLRPENVEIHKIGLNPEIYQAIPQSYRHKDVKSQGVQAALQVAAVPLVRMVDGLKSGALKDKSNELAQMAFTSLSMISSANSQLNQIRREAIRPVLNSRYRSICVEPAAPSKLLFGSDLAERCKQAQTAAQLAASITGQTRPQRGGYSKQRSRGGSSSRGRQGSYGRPGPYQTYGMYGAYGNYGWPRGGKKSKGKTYKYKAVGQSSNGVHSGSDSDVKIELKDLPVVSCVDSLDKVSLDFMSLPVVSCVDSLDKDSLEMNLPGILSSSAERKVLPEEGEQEEAGLSAAAAQSPPSSHDVVSYESIPMDLWGEKFEAGRVALCVDYWAKFTTDPVVLRYVRGVELDFEEDMPEQGSPMPEMRFSTAEREFVREEIISLLQKRVISRVDHVDGEFISNIFIVEKSEPGKYRMILNLKRLNKYLKKAHFKMDCLANAISLIVPNCTFHSFDFSDAYYSIKIAPHHRKYLRFYFEGQLYEYSVIPNGLTSGPRIFTKMMKVVLAYLRKEHDISISGFLDDQIMCHYDGTEDAMKKGKLAAIHFQKCGFTISIPKSVAEPGVTRIAHLGFILDSVAMRAFLSDKKTAKLIGAIDLGLSKERITIRELASLKGRIEATGFANTYAKLFSKRLEIQKIEALRCKGYNYEAKIILSDDCREDLRAVKELLPGTSAPLILPPPDEILKSDSSQKGWGVFRPHTDEKGGGQWTEEEQLDHINVLELKACLFALKSFCSHCTDKHIRLVTDNTCSMYCIRRQGSSKEKLNDVAREIWLFAKARNLFLSSMHLAGKLNVESDRESRVFDETTEWSLRQDIYEEIVSRFGTPTIDLFASRLNHKSDRYCAWKPDPGAESIDCFMRSSWKEEFFYAFPPFSLMYRVIQKCIQDKAEGILVAPVWVTQPWFNLVKRCTIGTPILFTVTNDELFLPFSSQTKVHPLAPLRMQALRISGMLPWERHR